MRSQFGAGFRLYNQFAVFTYSQLQNILPDSVFGNISDWERCLTIDLSRTDLPFETADEFILNEDYHRLVTTSKLPRPSKFIEQTISFCKSFCGILLSHEIVKSDLIRGLACFDSAVILHGTEDQYIIAVESFTSHFVDIGWMSSSEKKKAVSQYRSFVAKFRACGVTLPEDWFQFMASTYELQSRPELYRLFKYAGLCLPPQVQVPVPFVVPIPELGSDEDVFRSCIGSVQMSFNTIPNVSSLYRDQRSISRVFQLLGRGKDLLLDRKFTVWNFLKGSNPRRTTLQSSFESAYKRASVAPMKLSLPDDGDITYGNDSCTSNSSASPRFSLAKATISLPRCEPGGSGTQKPKEKANKSKKN